MSGNIFDDLNQPRRADIPTRPIQSPRGQADESWKTPSQSPGDRDGTPRTQPPKKKKRRWLRITTWSILTLFFICGLTGSLTAWYYYDSFKDHWTESRFGDGLLQASAIEFARRTFKEVRQAVHDESPKSPGQVQTVGQQLDVSRTVATPTMVYDRNGVFIGKFVSERRILVPTDRVSANFVEAVIASEDVGFKEHSGVNYRGLFRSAYQSLVEKSTQGGSSITMQLAHLILDRMFLEQARRDNPNTKEIVNPRTIRQRSVSKEGIQTKMEEIFFAWDLESIFDKRDILFLYCNMVHFGLHRDREHAGDTDTSERASDAAMEPGLRDREHALEELGGQALEDAAMEPGLRDREHLPTSLETRPGCMPQWSPVLETGNTAAQLEAQRDDWRGRNGARS